MTHEKCCSGSSKRPENSLPSDTRFCQDFLRLFVASLVQGVLTSSRFSSNLPNFKNAVRLVLTKLAGLLGTAWSLSSLLTQKTATL